MSAANSTRLLLGGDEIILGFSNPPPHDLQEFTG